MMDSFPGRLVQCTDQEGEFFLLISFPDGFPTLHHSDNQQIVFNLESHTDLYPQLRPDRRLLARTEASPAGVQAAIMWRLFPDNLNRFYINIQAS
jgi:hypothetical protein